MIALMVSQLRQLLPFAMLWAVLSGLAYTYELFSTRVDEQDFIDWCSTACGTGSNLDQLLFLLFFCMLAAYRLFPREFDDGTIDFVRSLPVAKSRIFFSKVLTAWLLICALLTAEFLITSSLLQFNRQTISGQIYPATLSMILLRDCLFALVIVAHGVFISWFRVTGLVLYCAYLIGLYWLEEAMGISGIFSLFRFYNSEFFDQQILFDWPAITAQLIIAALLLAISYRLWNTTESQPRAKRAGIVSKYGPGFMVVIAFLLASIALVASIANRHRSGTSANINHLATEHYRFSYSKADQAQITELLQFADQDYQTLATLLGVENRPFIQARMTLSSNHAFGYASHTEIRMKLGDGRPVNPLYRRVLSHETTHVFQSVESNRALSKSRNSVGFFLEGMAQYTSFAVVPDSVRRDTNWAISSVAWKRQNITFGQLANRTVFDSTYNPELLYGIGDIWVDAMARQCGEQSPGEFLRSLATSNLPPNLQGEQYWRLHLNDIGCDLEQINHLWRTQMQQIADRRIDGAFPVYSNVTTSTRDDQLLITATVTPDENGSQPERYLIRIASETSIANRPPRVLTGRVISTGSNTQVQFSVPLLNITGQRYRYQIGFAPYPDSRHYFEKWRNGTIPRE